MRFVLTLTLMESNQAGSSEIIQALICFLFRPIPLQLVDIRHDHHRGEFCLPEFGDPYSVSPLHFLEGVVGIYLRSVIAERSLRLPAK